MCVMVMLMVMVMVMVMVMMCVCGRQNTSAVSLAERDIVGDIVRNFIYNPQPICYFWDKNAVLTTSPSVYVFII